MFIDFYILCRQISQWINWVTGGPRDMTFSAYSFELMVSREGWLGLWGAWRVQVIDIVFERLRGREFHCLDAWLRESKDTSDG